MSPPGRERDRPRKTGPTDRTAAKQSTIRSMTSNVVALPGVELPPSQVRGVTTGYETAIVHASSLLEELVEAVAGGRYDIGLLWRVTDQLNLAWRSVPPHLFMDRTA